MQTNFIQPGGNTSVQSSTEVLSQLLNIPQSSIGLLTSSKLIRGDYVSPLIFL